MMLWESGAQCCDAAKVVAVGIVVVEIQWVFLGCCEDLVLVKCITRATWRESAHVNSKRKSEELCLFCQKVMDLAQSMKRRQNTDQTNLKTGE